MTRSPSQTTASTAFSTRCAASNSPRWRSINAPVSIVAAGLTLFCPTYLGAEPCTGSNTASFSPIFAPGAIPSPPTRPEHRSDKMSPKRLVVTITSNWFGSRTSCIAMLSTIRSSNSISG